MIKRYFISINKDTNECINARRVQLSNNKLSFIGDTTSLNVIIKEYPITKDLYFDDIPTYNKLMT